MKMKDSGIEWIGEIPEDWEIILLSSLFYQHKEKNVGMKNSNLLSLSYGKIKQKDISTTDGLLPENFEGYNVISAGDIVLRLTDLQNDHKSLRVGHCEQDGIVTSAYITLRKRNNNLNTKYFYYLFHTFDIEKGFYGMGSGVRQGLNFDELKKLVLCFPPLETQQKIVAAIEAKTTKIDALVSNEERQIEKLKAYKQALITETVTKGLDKTAKMKDSGVEWIGEIPEGWEVVRLKAILKNISEKGYGDSIVLSLYRDYGVIPKDSRDDNHNVTSLDTNSYKHVRVNDLVINKMKAWQGSLSVSNYEGIVSPAYYVCEIKQDKLIPRFLHHFLRNKMLVQKYEQISAGMRIGQWDMGIDDFLGIYIFFPTIEKQKEICDFIDTRCSQIDRLISLKESKIEKLSAYKKSLIYEYVTGKKQA